MTTPKTEHKIRKHIATEHPGARRAAAPVPEGPANVSTAMIEACDRLGQKLDLVTGLVQEQIEAWRQVQPPSAAPATGRATPVSAEDDALAASAASSVEENPKPEQPSRPSETKDGQDKKDAALRRARQRTTPPPEKASQAGPALWENQQNQDAGARAQEEPPAASASAPPAGAPESGGPAPDASRLIDTIARSLNGWQEQAAGTQQTLEAIMAYLESQAADAAPKVEVAGIMSRLRDLEVQQQNLQTQFNTNRLGP